jgi:hypothetical protein
MAAERVIQRPFQRWRSASSAASSWRSSTKLL